MEASEKDFSTDLDSPDGDQLTRLVLHMVRHANEPQELLRGVCRYLGAVCGVLWLRDSYTQDEFKVWAHYNRPDFSNVDDVFFSLRDDDIVAAQAFEHGRSIAGKIGEPPFSGKWLEKHYTNALLSVGAKYIIVSPVLDFTLKPFGVLSLYFSCMWHDFDLLVARVKLVNEAIYTISRYILMEVDRVVGERRKMGHEITSAVNSIRQSLSELEASSEKDAGAESSKRRAENFADVKSSVDQIQHSTRHYKFIDSVRELRKSAQYMDFRTEFNSTAQPLIKKHLTSRVIMNPLRIDGGELSLLFARPHLRELVANLVGNAIKYSSIGGTINSLVKRVATGTTFQISNLSRGIPLDERDRIWAFRFRGSNVLQTEIPGDGIGLNVVRDICDVYGLSYSYVEDPREGSNLIWSRFTITVPDDLARWSKAA